ncbi:type II toxin-antitoxin system ParD family antitoxin [Methylobacterium sp. SD274]|nr:type II toxin-antitoxin system ParD family antitoxin [Methylobacterium sp. SD274]MBO1022544.1 type II toxin-antitoxin system ParD family antitoxin [Methylobacterium sp. SD274]
MSSADTISITMTPDLQQAVRESIEAGEYSSTNEVMHDALRLWQRQRLEEAERLTEIRARVRRSLGDARQDLTAMEADVHLARLFAGEGAKTSGA